MDQGSRLGRAIVETERRKKYLINDHHWSEALPEDSLYEPVATNPLLTYGRCKQLHPHVKGHTDWLAVTGTYGRPRQFNKISVAVFCQARGDSEHYYSIQVPSFPSCTLHEGQPCAIP